MKWCSWSSSGLWQRQVSLCQLSTPFTLTFGRGLSGHSSSPPGTLCEGDNGGLDHVACCSMCPRLSGICGRTIHTAKDFRCLFDLSRRSWPRDKTQRKPSKTMHCSMPVLKTETDRWKGHHTLIGPVRLNLAMKMKGPLFPVATLEPKLANILPLVPQTVYCWGSILGKKELATLTGRAPELSGWALCPGLVLLLSSVAGLCSVSRPCPPLVLCGWALSSSCPCLELCGWALCPLSSSCPCLGRAPELCGWSLWPGLLERRVAEQVVDEAVCSWGEGRAYQEIVC